MNEYASLRKSDGLRSGLVIALVLLLVLELCSLSVLFGQLTAYSTVQQRTYISLTEGSENGTVTVSQREPAGSGLAYRPAVHLAPSTLSVPSGAVPAVLSSSEDVEDPNGDKTGFKVYDENTVWTTHTDVEIFSVHYDDNGDGHYTTASSNKDKVFAPGTTQSYTFTLANNKDKTLDYRLTIKAYYENTDGLWIPIEGRLSDYTGAWLVGSATEWPDVLKLDGFVKEGKLYPNYEADYTIDWRWPFERFDGEGLDANDEYDTMLGNTAVNKDLILHIVIMTEAWVDEEVPPSPTPTPKPSGTPKPGGGGGGGHPKTGDYSRAYLWGAVSLVSMVLLMLIVYAFYKDGRKRKHDA